MPIISTQTRSTTAAISPSQQPTSKYHREPLKTENYSTVKQQKGGWEFRTPHQKEHIQLDQMRVAEDDSNVIKIRPCRSSAVRRWLPTAAARVRVLAACGVCGGQRGTGAGFLRVLRFSLPIIPPISPLS
jgi:hypothetical protein